MFNAIAHALLALAPEFDAVRVEDVPMSLKAWIDGSQGNIRRETLGAKCMARHFFANKPHGPARGRECVKLAVDKSL